MPHNLGHDCPVCGCPCDCEQGNVTTSRCQCCEGDEIHLPEPNYEPDYNAEESRYLDRQNARAINRKVG